MSGERPSREAVCSSVRVLSPCDVEGLPGGPRAVEEGAWIRLGGRVVGQRDRDLVLADAFAEIIVSLAREPTGSPGALVVVEGRVGDGRLCQAVVISERPLPEPARGGEHARLRWEGVGSMLLARSRALDVIRGYFARERFVEVQTPGRLRAPALEANVDAIPTEQDWLCTSPELHMKRLLVGGMPRIFQLCRTWRADEVGTWHEPEFHLLEWYRAFAEYDAVLQDTERLVHTVVETLRGEPRLRGPAGHSVDVTPPFERLTLRDAFRRYAGVDDAPALAAESPDRYFELLVDRIEPALRQRPHPVFLVEYPASEAALARTVPRDPAVAERFELYLAGIELCNGYGELVDPSEQRRRFAAERSRRVSIGSRPYPFDERFLAALDEGMPPSAGNALGVDRLVALAVEAPGIAAVQAFPEAER